MQKQTPIKSRTVCDLMEFAANAADLVTGDRSDWPLRDCAVPLLSILVEQEVSEFEPLDLQGRTHKQRQALGKNHENLL